jgi:hypothetical protein
MNVSGGMLLFFTVSWQAGVPAGVAPCIRLWGGVDPAVCGCAYLRASESVVRRGIASYIYLWRG